MTRSINRARQSACANCFSLFALAEVVRIARARDAERQRGSVRGPLHGIPFMNKDMFKSRLHPVRCGSYIDCSSSLQAGPSVTERLADQGAIEIGVAHQAPFGLGLTGANELRGECCNPRDPSRIVGGSSSGSAAIVADGIVPVSFGTDTGGSIRIPAAFCGVVGFKPSGVPMGGRGMVPLVPSMDVSGPITRCISDAQVVMDALEPSAKQAPLSSAPRLGFPVGLPTADPDVNSSVRRAVGALAETGFELVSRPAWDTTELTELSDVIIAYEINMTQGRRASKNPGAYSLDMWPRIVQGRTITSEQYAASLKRRDVVRSAYQSSILNGVDALVIPTVPMRAPTFRECGMAGSAGRSMMLRRIAMYVRFASFAGLPAVSLPLPTKVRRGGLPVGLQLVGSPGSDSRVLQLAALVESSLRNWSERCQR